jgi:hypothetical protein
MSYRQIVASGPKRFWLGFITNTPLKGRPLEIQLEFLRRTRVLYLAPRQPLSKTGTIMIAARNALRYFFMANS